MTLCSVSEDKDKVGVRTGEEGETVLDDDDDDDAVSLCSVLLVCAAVGIRTA